MTQPLIQFTSRGMYCAAGDFYIDPWRPVDRAVITHAHADHARWGMKRYMATPLTKQIMLNRISPDLTIQSVDFGESISVNGVVVSFHPAGHIPGSAQVRVEYKGEVWVAAGDYKLSPDPIAGKFENVKCHTFITESTFGLPVFRWEDDAVLKDQLHRMIESNSSAGKNTILFGYSLGKAQRLHAMLDFYIHPIYLHGAIANMTELIERETGVALPSWIRVTRETILPDEPKVIIAPPNAHNSAWTKKFKPFRTVMASGWMNLRGTRRRRNMDEGLVMSDHADFNELLTAIGQSEAEKVIVTHGYTEIFSRHLRELGYDAISEKTAFEGEGAEDNQSEEQEA